MAFGEFAAKSGFLAGLAGVLPDHREQRRGILLGVIRRAHVDRVVGRRARKRDRQVGAERVNDFETPGVMRLASERFD